MAPILLALAALLLNLAGGAHAQSMAERPVVVELYTSQGCSSCPPADALLAEMAGRDDVIPLALHVDYWDYIGWADVFADPAHTARQRAYARIANARTVYTPQMIVGGMDHIVGTRKDDLAAALKAQGAKPATVALRLLRQGRMLRIEARALAPLVRGAVVQLVRYEPLRSVVIGRGENGGRTLSYSSIVTSWRKVADWDGRADFALDLAAPGAEPAVVIIQEPGPGPILAAARLR